MRFHSDGWTSRWDQIVVISWGIHITKRERSLTHCGLATPYGDIDLGHHWPRQWLVAWRHQAITWTNVDLSLVKSCGIHLRAVSHEMLKISTLDVSLKIINLRLHPHLQVANELNWLLWFQVRKIWPLFTKGSQSHNLSYETFLWSKFDHNDSSKSHVWHMFMGYVTLCDLIGSMFLMNDQHIFLKDFN